jgi:hypothetical protein
MRRGWGIAALVLTILLLVGVGIGAYHAGVDEGIRRGADAGQVVEVVGGYGYGGHGGFFPFGLLLFPLVIVGVVLLFRAAFGGPRWGGGWYGPGSRGPWSEEGRARFEERAGEWHRRQHEQRTTSPDPGGDPASPERGGGSAA